MFIQLDSQHNIHVHFKIHLLQGGGGPVVKGVRPFRRLVGNSHLLESSMIKQ